MNLALFDYRLSPLSSPYLEKILDFLYVLSIEIFDYISAPWSLVDLLCLIFGLLKRSIFWTLTSFPNTCLFLSLILAPMFFEIISPSGKCGYIDITSKSLKEPKPSLIKSHSSSKLLAPFVTSLTC